MVTRTVSSEIRCKRSTYHFIITALYTGMKKAKNWDSWAHNIVTVQNATTGKRISFDFWESQIHPRLETEYDLGNAFRCFVDDAIMGSETFHDFCFELGYDEDSRKAYDIWQSCGKATDDLREVYHGDLYDLLNDLEEYA